MPSLDANIMFVSSDLPQGCVTSVKSVSLARTAAAQPTFSELAPHGLVRIDKGLYSFNIMSACVSMLRMGASEAQASKWLSLAYPLQGHLQRLTRTQAFNQSLSHALCVATFVACTRAVRTPLERSAT